MESKSDPDPPSDSPSCSVSENPTEKEGTINSSDTEESNKEVTNNERRASMDDPDKTNKVKDFNSVVSQFDNSNGQEIRNIEVDRGKDSQHGEEKRGVGPSGDTLKENEHSDKKGVGPSGDTLKENEHSDKKESTDRKIFSEHHQNKQEQSVVSDDKSVGPSGDSLKENEHSDKKDVGSTKQSHSSGFQQSKQAQIESTDHKLFSEHYQNKPEQGVVSDDKKMLKQISSDSQSKKAIHSDPELEERAAKDSAVELNLQEEKPKQFSSDSQPKKTILSEPEHAVEDIGSKLQVKDEMPKQFSNDSVPKKTIQSEPEHAVEDIGKKAKQFSSDTHPKKTIHTEAEYVAEDTDNKVEVKEEKLKQTSGDSQSKKTIYSDPVFEKNVAKDSAVKLQVQEEKPKQFFSESHPKKTIQSKPEHVAEDNTDSGTPPQVEDEDGSLQRAPLPGLAQQIQPQISTGGDSKLLWIGFLFVVLAVICGLHLPSSDSTLPVQNKFNVVDMFNREMEKLKTSFPSQHSELWKRSLIHLRRHLKTEHPTEPVSLILTSGRGAEKTLGCLAQCLAQAFSTTRNSSVLSINGKGKTSLDSDQVKLDMDSELTKAFESKTFAAVIHRFEELPPGSTLIFYRYCDHENAAYKNVFLAFTIMLDAEVEVLSNVNLSTVEEIVLEYVKQKFVSSDKSAMFNQMDLDKLSGLWSRISHLILPVVAEKRIEQQGCGDCNKSI